MSKTGNILIVEDKKDILEALELFLEDEFNLITGLQTPNLIISALRTGNYDLVLLDMNFTAGIVTGNEGLYWLKEILNIDPTIIVIMMTAYGDIALAVKAMKNGAADFIVKPWDNEKLMATLRTALKLRESNKEIEKLRNRQDQLSAEIDNQFSKIICESPQMIRVMDIVEKVSKTDVNILVTGENGTGKGLIAREIHKRSNRSKEAIITVDMASIPATLFESEMFGHTKGAFTDAKQDRTGRFVTASGGTLFLDEIGNLPLNMQSKILNVLQERHIIPLGSNKMIPIDIRLICATNKNLDKMVMEGLFRQDLLFRVNTIQIDLPPLRERGTDIDFMATHFVDRYAVKYNRGSLSFTREALNAMKMYTWPGNIRELEHTIEKAVILAKGSLIRIEDLHLKKMPNMPGQQKKDNLGNYDDYEREIIRKALLRNLGNLTNAARELGISRQTIYNKMKRYGL
jgi:DNA-binding NtrC family response regulator